MTLIGIFANHGTPVNGLLPDTACCPEQTANPDNRGETFQGTCGRRCSAWLPAVRCCSRSRRLSRNAACGPGARGRPGKRCRASQRPDREEVAGVRPHRGHDGTVPPWSSLCVRVRRLCGRVWRIVGQGLHRPVGRAYLSPSRWGSNGSAKSSLRAPS